MLGDNWLGRWPHKCVLRDLEQAKEFFSDHPKITGCGAQPGLIIRQCATCESATVKAAKVRETAGAEATTWLTRRASTAIPPWHRGVESWTGAGLLPTYTTFPRIPELHVSRLTVEADRRQLIVKQLSWVAASGSCEQTSTFQSWLPSFSCCLTLELMTSPGRNDGTWLFIASYSFLYRIEFTNEQKTQAGHRRWMNFPPHLERSKCFK